jgi:CIC family chloride channel protein
MANPLASLARTDWRRRILGNYLQKWMILGALIGVVAGVGAIVFFEAINLAQDLLVSGIADVDLPVPRGEGDEVIPHVGRRWLIPAVVVLGGIISGIIVFTLAPEAEGHGTDAAIEAFHQRGGKIRSIIPPVKLVASAITIGSGGSAGREGPTAQIAAGFGSWLGDIFRLSAEDRRIALAVGVGAGIGAIFKAPLGGSIIAAEILYTRDFELDALIPGFIASVIGYSIFATYTDWTPIFGDAVGLEFSDPEQLVWYSVLGVAAAVVGVAYVRFFYGTRDAFKRIRVPPHVKPAIGGLGVGLIALAFPEVLSMGYGWVQYAIDGNTEQLAVRTMVALVVLKIVATSLTIGSGGSGGVFAPGLYIGGMLGGSLWWLLADELGVGWMPDSPAPFVIVGMAALFGGIAKAPIAVMLMVAEMTGEFTMIVPAMFATSIAYLVTGNVSIYENQVRTRADSPAHRGKFTIPLVQAINVGQAMRHRVFTTNPQSPIVDAEATMKDFNVRGLPVIEDSRLVGMFTMTDALRGSRENLTTVGEAMTRVLIVAYPGDSLHTALQRMTRAGISRLPVVEREHPDRLIGILSMKDMGAMLDLEISALASAPQRQPIPGRADDPLRSVVVEDAMRGKFETVSGSTSLKRIANRLAIANAHCALVVGEDGALTGILTLGDIEKAAAEEEEEGAELTAADIAARYVVVATRTQSVAEALGQPGAEGLRQIPVVEARDGRIYPVGLLSRTDVVAVYLRGRDRQAQIARRAETLAADRPDDVISLDLPVLDTDAIVGRTLAELKLPRDAVITSVLRHGDLLIPRGHLTLEPDDRILILTLASMRDQIIEHIHSGAPLPEAQDTPPAE